MKPTYHPVPPPLCKATHVAPLNASPMQFCTAISYNRMRYNLQYDIIHKSIFILIQITTKNKWFAWFITCCESRSISDVWSLSKWAISTTNIMMITANYNRALIEKVYFTWHLSNTFFSINNLTLRFIWNHFIKNVIMMYIRNI